MKRLTAIAAVGAKTRVIGRDNKLPWSMHLAPDLKRFKRLTLGGVLFTGLNTYLSLPEHVRPLPGRKTIIVSSTFKSAPEGVLVFPTLVSALDFAEAHFDEEGFIIGGSRMYEEGLAHADRLEITEVGEDPPGDTFFPDYSAFSKIIEECDEPDFPIPLKYRTLERP